MDLGEKLKAIEDKEKREEIHKKRQEEKKQRKENQRRAREKAFNEVVKNRREEYRWELEENDGVMPGGISRLIEFMSYEKSIGLIEWVEENMEELPSGREIISKEERNKVSIRAGEKFDLEEEKEASEVVEVREFDNKYTAIYNPQEDDLKKLADKYDTDYLYLENKGDLESNIEELVKIVKTIIGEEGYEEFVIQERYKPGNVMGRKAIRPFWYDVIDESMLEFKE